MKAFGFRLDKVLDWRRTELSLAESRFQQQTAALAAIDQSRASLDAAALAAETALRSSSSVEGSELAALDAFRRHLAARRAELAAARIKAHRELDVRRGAMLESRRRVRLLERLKDRRLSEWRHDLNRELDELASESHLARFAAADRLLR